MSKKTCDAFLCTKLTPKKYRYCYDCAKSKGLVTGGTNWIGWIIAILILMMFFG
jgi:RNA polymerase subunit RPABC4/transcription elongation factor Spt4